jgi:hypothetical protein
LLSEIKHWQKYFKEQGVLIDSGYAKFILSDLKKKNRENKENGLVDNKLYAYRKSMVEDLFMSTEEYLNGNSLEVRGFLRSIEEGSKLRIFPRYELTPTYRLITSNPSIGNLDTYLKKLIVPREGYNLVSIDYKHQEPWIIVNLLENNDLMDILDSSDDFYMGILNKFQVEQSDLNRGIMKNLWNSSIYGSSLDNLKGNDKEWVAYIYNWINGLKEVKSLRKKVERNLKSNKEIYTVFGLNRSIPYDGLNSVRRAFNSIFQISGSGVMYAGLKTIHNAVKPNEPDNINIYFTNHDEYILESPVNLTNQQVVDSLSGLFLGVEGWTKPKFEIRIGKNWGDCK